MNRPTDNDRLFAGWRRQMVLAKAQPGVGGVVRSRGRGSAARASIAFGGGVLMGARRRSDPWFLAEEKDRFARAEVDAMRNRGELVREVRVARIWNADPVEIRMAWYPNPRWMRPIGVVHG